MKKFKIIPGMKFVCSNEQIKEFDYLKDYEYTVIRKQGSKFLVRFYDGIMYGEDLFYKYELENLKLVF